MKKTVLSLLLAAAISLSLAAPCLADDPPLFGDVDGDGRINALDVVSIMRYLVGFSSVDTDLADYDRNGRVNSLDVLLIMKSLVDGEGSGSQSGYQDPDNPVNDDIGEWLPIH